MFKIVQSSCLNSLLTSYILSMILKHSQRLIFFRVLQSLFQATRSSSLIAWIVDSIQFCLMVWRQEPSLPWILIELYGLLLFLSLRVLMELEKAGDYFLLQTLISQEIKDRVFINRIQYLNRIKYLRTDLIAMFIINEQFVAIIEICFLNIMTGFYYWIVDMYMLLADQPIIIIINQIECLMSRRGYSYDNSNNHNSKNNNNKKMSITFLLISATDVGIYISYNLIFTQLKDLIRNRFYGEWNKDLKLWQIKLAEYNACFQEIKKLMQTPANKYPDALLNKIPEFVFRADKEMQMELQIKNSPYSVVRALKYNEIQTSIQARVLPFYYKLYDFQKESLDFAIRKHGRMLLGDEMGVGKTIQSLAIASVYRHQWPFLVICPSSLRLNWQQEALNWLSQYLKKTQIQVFSTGRTQIKQSTKMLIVSYDMAWKIKDLLQTFKVVIADEAHYLKNTGNKRSDILCPYLSSRKRIILLTGTPALAKPRQIYNLLSIVRPDLYTNFKQFGYRYCQPTINPWSRALEYNGCQNSKELHYLISNKIMIRRLKKQVLTQLPDKQRQKVIVQTDKNIIKEIKSLLSQHGNGSFQSLVIDMLHKFDSKEQNQGKDDIRQAITIAYKLSGQAKLESTKDYILQLLENDIKILIFAHHMVVLDGLQDMLKQKKIKYMRIDGSISKEVRHQNVTRFQQDTSLTVALLSITAAGVGLTLTAASTVVFAQLHWTPGNMIQAQDRAHRIGQKTSVNCHYLIGQNSLDDILYRQLQRKINNVTSFVDGKLQNLKIEKLSKGQKGKIANKSEQVDKGKNESLLFKFQSVKPIVDKYFIQQNSQTDISVQKTERCESDIDQGQNGLTKDGVYYPSQIKEEFKEIQSNMKRLRQIQDSQEQYFKNKKRENTQIVQFIAENKKQLIEYSQKKKKRISIDSSSSSQTA